MVTLITTDRKKWTVQWRMLQLNTEREQKKNAGTQYNWGLLHTWMNATKKYSITQSTKNKDEVSPKTLKSNMVKLQLNT